MSLTLGHGPFPCGVVRFPRKMRRSELFLGVARTIQAWQAIWARKDKAEADAAAIRSIHAALKPRAVNDG